MTEQQAMMERSARQLLENRLQNLADDYRDLHAENVDLRATVARLKAENEKLLGVIIDGAVDAYKREHNLT